jgi:hypothetical protein
LDDTLGAFAAENFPVQDAAAVFFGRNLRYRRAEAADIASSAKNSQNY